MESTVQLTIAEHLQNWAARENRTLSNETAAAIVLSTKAGLNLSTKTDAQVLRLIGPDHDEAGISAAIGGETKKQLSADVTLLRWRLFIWQFYQKDALESYERKNQKPRTDSVFVRHFRDNIEPDVAWLDSKIAELAAQEKTEAAKAQTAKAQNVWKGLTASQKRKVDEVVKEECMTALGDPETKKARIKQRLLLDDEYIASLSSVEMKPTAKPTPIIKAEAVDVPPFLARIISEYGIDLDMRKIALADVLAEIDDNENLDSDQREYAKAALVKRVRKAA